MSDDEAAKIVGELTLRAVTAEKDRDRLRGVLHDWWVKRRPTGWTEEQHREAPFLSPDGIGCGLDRRMVRALLGMPEEEGE